MIRVEQRRGARLAKIAVICERCRAAIVMQADPCLHNQDAARLRAYRAGWRVSVKALGPVELVRDICPGCGGKS